MLDAKTKLEIDKRSKSRKIKEIIKKYPKVYEVLLKLRTAYLKMQSRERIFSKVYETNAWGDEESLSGSGSNLKETEAIRKKLPALFKKLKIKSLVDIPCGDFYWMKSLLADCKSIKYFGGDIVPEMILINNSKYKTSKIKFEKVDLVMDKVPKGDAVLCRDCLIHLSFKDGLKAIENICNSKSGYLLSTTFPHIKINKNSPTGPHGREINLELAPYNFPKPLSLINEGVANCPDKCLGIWKIKDLTK
jgi:hypothetical protein